MPIYGDFDLFVTIVCRESFLSEKYGCNTVRTLFAQPQNDSLLGWGIQKELPLFIGTALSALTKNSRIKGLP
ncbi:hypothetical protein HQ45_05245 [Porphyromonas crevioricanis]|uniref:Uncharacterized protein n=1 Tax=Porphyromonas crevioricanis TaxID=393921 RepID=A0A0A2FV04_9PORP|nr:hypothetical protein HQ45_05245 [Porphyromonas crevioricanis]KGN94956.1 hypothetical protein HQ38_05415 [Porphyromonas crevioricanis]GAD07984.1 hypothetical protein PORCAN_1614 [Porphyromonas crevioricanis JCM 13913]SJZ82595.1 hypothetical protein SAMN02745203_00995 [Porphyromonas crevioricanis]SQH72603.1 Uncharacterised protein [Porphyromonas crevioricanis]